MPREKEYIRPFGPQVCVMGNQPPCEDKRGLKLPRRLLTPLETPFYRFLARFSGRRRGVRTLTTTTIYQKKYPPRWHLILVLQIVLIAFSLVNIVEGCSSRSTPKPRPPAPTPRPNITFLTHDCPPAYAAWYCLNGATCFIIKIQNTLLYNCMCANGYQGSRCEFKDLEGSYIPERRVMLETASIAGGATIAVFSAVILCLAVYLRWRRRKKSSTTSSTTVVDQVDGPGRTPDTFSTTTTQRQRIFGVRPQGHNLVSIRSNISSSSSCSNNNNSNNSCSPTTSNNNVPLHEPNLLRNNNNNNNNNNNQRIMESTTLPLDRGDHQRGEPPPWSV